jgi:hypothetical protein
MLPDLTPMNKSFSNSVGRPSFDPLHNTRRPSFEYVYGYYHRAIQDYYGGTLTRIEIELLEYFIFMSDYYLSYGHPTFYHSFKKVHEDTLLAIETIKSFVKKFKRLGILRVSLTYQYGRKVTTYQVEHLRIIRKRRLLFGSPDLKTDEQVQRIRKRFKALVKMYLEGRHILKRKQNRY